MPAAIWALAIATFGIGTTEFVIAGLLPGVAAEFGISISTAGYMATSYALGVFVGAPLLIMLGARVPQKIMLVSLMGFFIAGNLLTALAPSFAWALTGRVLTSLTHGAFIGIGSILAADLVAPNRRTSAIAFMFSGLTVANLIGIPAATWLGQVVSWRATFFAITAIGIVAMFAVTVLVPKGRAHQAPSIRRELAAFLDVHVLLAMGITVLGPAAFFTSITYIAPMMTEVTGYTENGVTGILFLFGLGLFIGNILGGKLADRALMPLLYVTLAAQAVVLFAFFFVVESRVASAVSVLLMAGFGFASVSPIQRLVMDKAGAAGAPNLAASFNIGLFNLGNAIGAWLGGWVIAQGFGYASPNVVGGLLSVAALALVVASGWLTATHGTHRKAALATSGC
ncbi:MFS transporter [Alcaligenaceae bacterium C4P045]|nr:MFS transporter [Alcaligenaceae bacterium C4P045]